MITISFSDQATTWLDYVSAAGSVGSALALVAAAFGLYQNAISRNLQTVGDYVSKLSDLRQNAFETGVYGDEYRLNPASIHAYQYLDFMEHMCFLVNRRHVTGPAGQFMLDWLRMEIPHICEQQAFRDFIDGTTESELAEFKALRMKIDDEITERKITGS